MVSVESYIVIDIPATFLILILLSSFYVKFNICMLGHVIVGG
jgi:hypothetical protein